MVKEYLEFIFLAALLLIAPYIITRRIMLKSMPHKTAKMVKIALFLKGFALITGMSAIGIVVVITTMNNDYFGAKDVWEYIRYLAVGLAPILILTPFEKTLPWKGRRLEITGAIIGFAICGIILYFADAFWGISVVVLLCVVGVYSIISTILLIIIVAIRDAIKMHMRKQEQEAANAPVRQIERCD